MINKNVEVMIGLLDAWDKAERERNSILCHVIKRTIEGFDTDTREAAVAMRLGVLYIE